MQIYTLTSKNITLRKLRLSDAPDLYGNINHPEISQFSDIPYPYSLALAQKLIRKTQFNLRKKIAFQWGIELNETKKIIGRMSLVHLDWKNKNAEVNYWMGKNHWGKGYAKEALSLVIDFAFHQLHFNRLSATVREGNVASAKLLEKSGFRLEGVARQVIHQNGHYSNRFYYGLISSDQVLVQAI